MVADTQPDLWIKPAQMLKALPLRHLPIVHVILLRQSARRRPVDQQVEVDLLVRMQGGHAADHAGQAQEGCAECGSPPRPAVADEARQPSRYAAHLWQRPALGGGCAASPRTEAQPGCGQQAERRPQELEVPPALIAVRLQMQRNADRQHQAAQQQKAEAQFAVAEHPAWVPYPLPADRRGADGAQQQRQRRRRDGEPSGNVVRRQRVRADDLPLEQVVEQHWMLEKHLEALQKSQRVGPIIGMQDVHGRQRRGREQPAGGQNAPLLCGVGRIQQVQGAHGQHGRQQQQAEDAQVERQADGKPAQRERA